MERRKLMEKVVHSLVSKLLMLLILASVGCFSSRPEDIQSFRQPEEAIVTMDEYVLHPPDEITLISTKIPLLAGTDTEPGLKQIILPDGTISIEDIGRISVAGKTPRQVADIIAEKYTSLYKLTGDYPVDVQVTNMSKHYYVVGQVVVPGAVLFSGRETVLAAVAKAIPNNLAWEEKIQVIRPASSSDARSLVFGLDFKKMAEHGDMSQNVLLKDGDIIYVPPTILASIGLTIGEIVGPIFSVSGAYTAVTPATP